MTNSNHKFKLRWLLAFFGGLMLLIALWLGGQWLIPGPAIQVSRETTYITSPLRPDGLPDYEQWELDRYRAGVTPENNAGVLLYQAIWPGDLDPRDYQLVCNELGLTKVPSANAALQDFQGKKSLNATQAWLKQLGIERDEDDFVYDVLKSAMDAPWTSQGFPPLAAWLAANQQPLDIAVEATRRSHCYLPSPSLLDDEHTTLIAVLLPAVQGTRNVARSLSARAMLHLGEGRFNEAWSDTLAIHRLACLAGQAHSLVERLVAIANHGIAQDATLAILSQPNLPPSLARQIQTDLAKLDRRISMEETLSTIERLSALDAVVQMKLYGQDILGADEKAERVLKSSSLDWNVVLRHVNRWYDRLAVALAVPDFATRQQAFDKFDADMEAEQATMKHPMLPIKALVSRQARSEMVGTMVTGLMIPALQAAISAQDRNTAMSQLLDVAVALAVYRADHGEYPETLEVLVPDQLPALPVDKFHCKPLTYHREADGYLLYCIGENGIDDGGSNEQFRGGVLAGRELPLDADAAENKRQQIPAGADDLSIRTPTPPFQIPTPPPPPPQP